MGMLPGKRVYRDSDPIIVSAQDVPGIFAEWADAIMAWQDYKTFGFPYSGGYKQHPAVWVTVMRILEVECRTWTEDQRPKK